jgi:ribosomal protein L11 methyltransferase (prmA)
LPQGQFDIVVANILANPLRMLGEMLAARTKQGGRIVLSGLLDEQVEELSDIYRQWFNIEPAEIDEGWARLSGVKR